MKVLERDPRGDYDRVLVDAEFGMPRDREIRWNRMHTTSPKKVAEEGKFPYFREIQVGEISASHRRISGNVVEIL